MNTKQAFGAVLNSGRNNVRAAIAKSARFNRTVTIYADDRETFRLLAKALEGLADYTDTEHKDRKSVV